MILVKMMIVVAAKLESMKETNQGEDKVITLGLDGKHIFNS